MGRVIFVDHLQICVKKGLPFIGENGCVMACTFSFYALPSQLREIQQIVKKHDLRFVGNVVVISGERPVLVEIEGDGQAFTHGSLEIRNLLTRHETIVQGTTFKQRLKNLFRNLFSKLRHKPSVSSPIDSR